MLSSLKCLSQPLCPDIWGGEADSQALAREQSWHSPGLLFRAKWKVTTLGGWVLGHTLGRKLNFFQFHFESCPARDKQTELHRKGRLVKTCHCNSLGRWSLI